MPDSPRKILIADLEYDINKTPEGYAKGSSLLFPIITLEKYDTQKLSSQESDMNELAPVRLERQGAFYHKAPSLEPGEIVSEDEEVETARVIAIDPEYTIPKLKERPSRADRPRRSILWKKWTTYRLAKRYYNRYPSPQKAHGCQCCPTLVCRNPLRNFRYAFMRPPGPPPMPNEDVTPASITIKDLLDYLVYGKVPESDDGRAMALRDEKYLKKLAALAPKEGSNDVKNFRLLMDDMEKRLKTIQYGKRVLDALHLDVRGQRSVAVADVANLTKAAPVRSKGTRYWLDDADIVANVINFAEIQACGESGGKRKHYTTKPKKDRKRKHCDADVDAPSASEQMSIDTPLPGHSEITPQKLFLKSGDLEIYKQYEQLKNSRKVEWLVVPNTFRLGITHNQNGSVYNTLQSVWTDGKWGKNVVVKRELLEMLLNPRLTHILREVVQLPKIKKPEKPKSQGD